jgi:hypothetical protein
MIVELAVTSGLGSSFDYMVWLGMGWYLVKPLWNLCDYFVPLCAFVIKICDILKYNLIG